MSKKTEAAVLFKLNSNLKLVKLNLPEPSKNQVLVKIYFSSICRSQLMEIYSGRKNKKWLPHMLGHEGVGKIIKLGKGVKNVKIGDNVILTWISLNKSKSNSKFKFNDKYINSGNVTTFSNYSIVSKFNVIKKPKLITNKLAVLLGCCISTGSGMVFNETNPKIRSKIVLIGLGGVGLGILLALKEKNINSVFIVEKDKKKIEIAKNLGYKNFTSGIKHKDKKNILKFFKSKADICYESAGSVNTIEFGISIVKSSGHFHFASHPESYKKIKIFPHEIISGKKITGSWGGSCNPNIDFKIYAKFIVKNKKLLNKVFEKEYPLKNINTAIKRFKDNKIFRPIIKMQH